MTFFFRFEPINPAELTYDTNHDKRKTRSKSPRTRYSSNKSPGPVSPTSLSAIGKYQTIYGVLSEPKIRVMEVM